MLCEQGKGGKMKDFIVINGVMGAGKSTVCKALQPMLPRCGFIEGDCCWTWRRDLSAAAREMVLYNIAFLADSYLACPDYDSVLLCWVIPDDAIFDQILWKMRKKELCRVHRFTLLPGRQALRRRLERDILDGRREPGAIERSMERYGLFQAQQTHKIDVSNISPAQAAQRIWEAVQARE